METRTIRCMEEGCEQSITLENLNPHHIALTIREQTDARLWECGWLTKGTYTCPDCIGVCDWGCHEERPLSKLKPRGNQHVCERCAAEKREQVHSAILPLLQSKDIVILQSDSDYNQLFSEHFDGRQPHGPLALQSHIPMPPSSYPVVCVFPVEDWQDQCVGVLYLSLEAIEGLRQCLLP